MSFEISQVVLTIVVGCLFLWRISYGAKNGLFAEAAGLIAAIAAFVAVYYIAYIAGEALEKNFKGVAVKVGYLVIAFAVYRLMNVLGDALRKVKEIPILGGLDGLLGAVIGGIEAYLIVYLVEYVTDFKILSPVYAFIISVVTYIQKSGQL